MGEAPYASNRVDQSIELERKETLVEGSQGSQ
jgi:hypothetical protein